MTEHSIVRVVSKILLPYILLFAFYVQFHGDFGPGGGFQAGVIFGAGCILYALVFGVKKARRVAPSAVVQSIMAVGLMLYAGVGFVCYFKGGNFLDYNMLRHDPHHAQELGVALIELGVGMAVAAVMFTIFMTYAERAKK